MSLPLSYYWLHINYDELHTAKGIDVLGQCGTKWLETCFISPPAIFIEVVIPEATKIKQENPKSHFESVGVS